VKPPRPQAAPGPLPHLVTLIPEAVDIHSTRDLIVLRILAEGPQRGAVIDRALRQVTGRDDLLPNSVYATLRRLADSGLIAKGVKRDDAPGNSAVYAITPEGEATLLSFLKFLWGVEPASTPRRVGSRAGARR
jgi:DNA-binding PadR family transcriptional regulator